jgi:ABC-type polysaccharide/polyol phosphate transport system ATPase subunit
MSSERPAVEFTHVSKRYRLRLNPGAEGAAQNLGKRDPQGGLWALRDVSFDVNAGSALGIVGPNGAGKTTILKLIAGITGPTSGRAVTHGRISALIELGAGFHPDLSGRENAYLAAAILGMKRTEIVRRFDEIVAFAGIEPFIDAPVKRYSAGMQARLAFSVAVHAEPAILLVDEVLSVGDAAFQVRCMERIHALRRQGVTLVLVSHYLGLIVEACEHAIFLSQGEVRFRGGAQETVNCYQDALRTAAAAQAGPTPSGLGVRSGSFTAEVTAVSLLDIEGNPRSEWDIGEPMKVRIEYVAHREIEDPIFGVEITRNDGLDCFATNTRWDGLSAGRLCGRGVVELHLPRLDLSAGSYTIGVGLLDRTGIAFLDLHERAYPFQIRTSRVHRGAMYLEHVWCLSDVDKTP